MTEYRGSRIVKPHSTEVKQLDRNHIEFGNVVHKSGQLSHISLSPTNPQETHHRMIPQRERGSQHRNPHPHWHGTLPEQSSNPIFVEYLLIPAPPFISNVSVVAVITEDDEAAAYAECDVAENDALCVIIPPLLVLAEGGIFSVPLLSSLGAAGV